MSILVVGSIALDTVETPYGRVVDSPGGSALYFSAAASFFAPVKVVGVVGKDFDLNSITFLKERQVDLEGLRVEEGETFRWGGRYHRNMNHRDTLFTYLNVFENFKPVLPPHYCNTPFLFLANIDPDLQLEVLQSIQKPKLVVLDTMNFWISGKRRALEEVIQKVDVIIVNDEEIRELTGRDNLYDAAFKLLEGNLRAVVIKKGEHGSVLVSREGFFFAPAFPVEKVVDPTGAGDSFAGGFLGYLASCPEISYSELKRAIVYGTIIASFNVEDFSFKRLKEIHRAVIEERFRKFQAMLQF